MADDELYDPRETDEVLSMEKVSLMPNWLGFSSIWAMGIGLFCLFLLLATVIPTAFLFPWYVTIAVFLLVTAFDVVLCLVVLAASIITPNHESTRKYLKRRYADYRGTRPVKSDTTLPSKLQK